MQQDAHSAIGESSFRLRIPYVICLSVDVHSRDIRLPLVVCRRIILSRADTCIFEGSIVAVHRVHEWARVACVKDDHSVQICAENALNS